MAKAPTKKEKQKLDKKAVVKTLVNSKGQPTIPQNETKSKKDSLSHYIGKAGHLAVMGEFALRGYNVAMPEIDYGDDIFVIDDQTARSWRIQVKTAQSTGGYSAVNPTTEGFQFNMREDQLVNDSTSGNVKIIIALRKRLQETIPRWRFLIIDRARLAELYRKEEFGTKSKGYPNVVFYVSFRLTGVDAGKLTAGETDLSYWMERWDEWPDKNVKHG